MLTVFGELSPENSHYKKYAKLKAAYIHNCLKNGETPVPGPLDGGEDADNPTGFFFFSAEKLFYKLLMCWLFVYNKINM